jgi:release factor glutamine methyltransferase
MGPGFCRDDGGGATVTVDALRRALAARFAAAGIDSAELDARLLLGAALKLDLTGLITSGTRRLTAGEAERAEAFAVRRLNGEPVARILGEKEFWGLPLKISADTLVPRPDTETVVEFALELVRERRLPGGAMRILDIGTGTGAILLALLSEDPAAFGVATDISQGALATARDNAAALGLASRAGFVACCYASALKGPFDLVVSNPPYIRSADIAGLAEEVRGHDPHAALDGGADGLDAYRALIPQAAHLLSHGGALVVEAGHDQAGEIEGLMTAAGLTVPGPPKADLAGIPRAIGGLKLPR